MFTEYRFTPEYLAAKVAERAAALKANRGMSDLLGFGLGVVRDRLAKDPRRYLDYGPYWWALKEALNARGADLPPRRPLFLLPLTPPGGNRAPLRCDAPQNQASRIS